MTSEMTSYLVNKYHEIRKQDRKLFFDNYEQPKVIIQDVIDFVQFKHMQLAILEKDGWKIFMFLGSNQFIDWLYNFWFRFSKTPYSETGTNKKIKAHIGFYKSYLLLRQAVHLRARNASKVICMGQSLGGAIATFAALDIQYNFNKELECLTTGSPKVGNKYFVKSYNKRVPQTFRYVYGNDIVPGLPPGIFGHRHVNKEIHIGPKRRLGLSIKDHLYNPSGAYLKDLTI